ncbi:LysR substrate-binding domain-containing protein [Vibrio metschnikovii]|uniref:LysR substrate-binding domain-containing protein n=1 Tax=Vibrio metschnikovii TaxID=28172 RepID=UPI002FE5C11F
MSQLPPLNALRAFEASARLGSFTKAADELNVTQAAVSQQVKILEHHLKATLFTREAKGIRLTDAGQSYQPVLSQVFHSLRIGTEDLFGERGNNTLSLRVSNTFAEHFLAPRLPSFLKDYPRFRVRLYTSPWSQSDQRSQPDIEIYNGYGDWDGRQVERLTHEYWQVVCRPQAINHYGNVTCAKQLLDWPRAAIIGYRETWLDWFSQQGITEIADAPCLEFDTTTLAIQAVRHGDIALLTRNFVVADPLAKGSLVLAHPASMTTTGGHYLVWKKGDHRPKVLDFCDWIRREVAKHHATQADLLGLT